MREDTPNDFGRTNTKKWKRKADKPTETELLNPNFIEISSSLQSESNFALASTYSALVVR